MSLQRNVRAFWKLFSKRKMSEESTEYLFASYDSVGKIRKKKWRLKLPKHKSKKKARQSAHFQDFDNPVTYSCLSVSYVSSLEHTPSMRSYSESTVFKEEKCYVNVHGAQSDTDPVSMMTFKIKDNDTSPLDEKIDDLMQFEDNDLVTTTEQATQRAIQVNNNELVCKLEEIAAHVTILEESYKEVLSENTNLKQKIVDLENLMAMQKSETKDNRDELLGQIVMLENIIDNSAKIHKDEIKKVSGDMKKLKRKTNKVSMFFNKTANCHVYTGFQDYSRTSGSDKASVTVSASSSGDRDKSSSDRWSSPDLSPDEDIIVSQAHGQEKTYTKEEDVWADLQNLEDAPRSIEEPLAPIEEEYGQHQTNRKEVYIVVGLDDHAALDILKGPTESTEAKQEVWESPLRAVTEEMALLKKLGIGQLYEGFIALHYYMKSDSFNAFSRQPDAYLKIIDHIVSEFAERVCDFLDMIEVPLYQIPEEICHGGNSVVVAYAVYTWNCKQSGPNATGTSLALEMCAKLSTSQLAMPNASSVG